MDDALNLGVLLEHVLQCRHIAAVNLLEGRTDARNLLDTIKDIDI